MQGSRHHQGKFWDRGLKKLGFLGHAEVLPTHRASWRRQGCPTGVLKLLSRTKQGLLTDNAQAADLLDVVIPIGNEPMARNQLNTGCAGVSDGDRIGERKLAVIRVRLVGQILSFDRYSDFMRIHEGILRHPRANCKLESRDG